MLLAQQAGFCKARHLTRRRSEMLVAPAAASALAEDKIGIVGHILDDLVGRGIAHDRAARHLNDQILAALAGAAAALPVHAVGRGVFALIAEVHQRGKIVVHAQDDVAAAAAVAAVRPARRDIFLAVERHGAVSAVAGLDGYFNFIYKHQLSPLLPDKKIPNIRVLCSGFRIASYCSTA